MKKDAEKNQRPSKDRYYLNIAKEVSRRSTCLKVLIGAIIVRDDQIIATGYVGAPRKTKSSLEHGFCLRQMLGIPSGAQYELCRSVHAEQNAIINAARAGVSLLNGDMFIYGEKRDSSISQSLENEKEVTGNVKLLNAYPCFICKKMIINSGLKRVVCSTEDGKFRIFSVDKWVKEWQITDIIEDKYQYGELLHQLNKLKQK
ncbi:MAG: dCMP deaminase family protein [Acidobacteriota bacterium]